MLNITQIEALLGPPLPAPNENELDPKYYRQSKCQPSEEFGPKEVSLEGMAIENEDNLLVLFVDDDGEREWFSPMNLWYPHSLFKQTGLVVGNTGRVYLKESDTPIRSKGPVLVWRKL